MESSEGIDLENIKEWPKELVNKLKQSWITTAEQVIAMISTPGGLSSLAEHLGVSEEETRRLVSVTRTYLPHDVVEQMEESVDVSKYGLGALQPKSDENKIQEI